MDSKRNFKWASITSIHFKDRVDFDAWQRLGLKFYSSNLLIVFYTLLHDFRTVKHLMLALLFNK